MQTSNPNSEPFQRELIIRYLPAAYVTEPVPIDLSFRAALRHALSRAMALRRFRCWVQLTPAIRATIESGGTDYRLERLSADALPRMKVRGSAFTLRAGGAEPSANAHSNQEVSQ